MRSFLEPKPIQYDCRFLLSSFWKSKLFCNSFSGHENTVFALDISPNSSVLISGSSDESLKVWDLNQWPPGKLNSIEEVHDLGKWYY